MPDILVTEHAVETILKLEIPVRVTEHAIETVINLSIGEVVTQHAVEYLVNIPNETVLTEHVIEFIPKPEPAPIVPQFMRVRRLRRTPTITEEDVLIVFNALEIDLQVGIGNVTEPGVDPMVVMQYSDDGGITWSDEHRLSAGGIGDFTRQVKWMRLGASRNRVFQIWCTDPCLWVLINGYLDMKKGRF